MFPAHQLGFTGTRQYKWGPFLSASATAYACRNLYGAAAGLRSAQVAKLLSAAPSALKTAVVSDTHIRFNPTPVEVSSSRDCSHKPFFHFAHPGAKELDDMAAEEACNILKKVTLVVWKEKSLLASISLAGLNSSERTDSRSQQHTDICCFINN